jgi:polyisoprenoid-binding protein YceI
MRRNVILGAAAAIAVMALIGAGAYAYFFSGLRTSPSSLALSASPTAGSTPTAASTGLAGTWKVTTGSLAGYRVQELFAGEASKHLAVARTSKVSGNLTLSGDSSGYQVSGITLNADLSGLHSVDQVVGRNVTQRDGIVSRQLNVQQFPNARFTATSASVPGPIAASPVDVTAAGKLTIHGVTRDVTASAKAQVVGDRIELAGTMTITMTDYGVTPPQVPFTAVDSTVTIEFDVFLART